MAIDAIMQSDDSNAFIHTIGDDLFKDHFHLDALEHRRRPAMVMFFEVPDELGRNWELLRELDEQGVCRLSANFVIYGGIKALLGCNALFGSLELHQC